MVDRQIVAHRHFGYCNEPCGTMGASMPLKYKYATAAPPAISSVSTIMKRWRRSDVLGLRTGIAAGAIACAGGIGCMAAGCAGVCRGMTLVMAALMPGGGGTAAGFVMVFRGVVGAAGWIGCSGTVGVAEVADCCCAGGICGGTYGAAGFGIGCAAADATAAATMETGCIGGCVCGTGWRG